MANITVTFADGTPHIYNNVPDDVTPDQIEERAIRDFGGRKITHIAKGSVEQPRQEQPSGQSAEEPLSADPRMAFLQKIGRSDIAKNLVEGGVDLLKKQRDLSAGSASSIGNIISNITPGSPSKAAMIASGSRPLSVDEALTKYTGSDPTSTPYKIGKIGTDIAVTYPIGGVLSQGLKSIPALANSARLAPYIEALKTGGMSSGTGILSRIAAGGTVGGATSGVINPDEALKGAAIGAALPIVSSTGGKIADLVGDATRGIYRSGREMLTRAGKEETVGRIMREASGEKNIPDVLARLRTGAADETMGQATRDLSIPELAAAQKYLEKIGPTKPLLDVKDAQELARQKLLSSVKPDLQDAIDTRKIITDPIYQAAKNAGDVVDTAPIASKIDDLLTKNPGNKELVRELNSIKSGLYDESGELRVNAEQVSSVLDGIKAQMANKENKFILGNLIEIKDDLVKSIPNMKQAQQKFSELSQPVNQSEIIGEMQKVISKPGGGERRTPFLNVIGKGEEALIKKTTGQPRYTDADLEKILTPQQNEAVNKIASQLEGQARDEYLAQAGREAFSKIIGKNEGISTVPMLNKVATIGNAILRRLSGKGGEEVDRIFANATLPENKLLLAKYMEKAKPADREAIKAAIEAVKIGAPKVIIPSSTKEPKRTEINIYGGQGRLSEMAR